MAEQQAIRFHLDEHMDPAIAQALRRAGIDVTKSADRQLLGQLDETHFVQAQAERRVIVTDDTDFIVLSRSDPTHPGIVFCRRTQHTLGDIIRFLILMHGVYEPADLVGQIEYP